MAHVFPPKLSTPARCSPAPELELPSRSASSVDLGRDLGKKLSSNFERGLSQEPNTAMGPSPSKGPKKMWLS